MEGFVEMDPTTGNRLAPMDPKMGVVFFLADEGVPAWNPLHLPKNSVRATKQRPSRVCCSTEEIQY